MIVFKIPFGSGSLGKSKGSTFAPDKIISKIQQDPLQLEEKEISLEQNNIEESLEKIKKEITELPFVALGGDHTITYSIIKKVADSKLGIVIFDAHPDLMQTFTVPTHENYLRHLIEEKIISPRQVVLVGVRNIDPEEKRFLDENKINHFTMQEISQEGVQEICDSIMEYMKDFKKMYISVDIDAADPAFAPGVAYPEVGGLSSKDLLYVLKRLMMMKNFMGGDIVEVIPEKDQDELTVNLAAKILKEMSERVLTQK